MRTITIQDAMDRKTIRRVVHAKVPERWRRASLTLTGSDDESTYSFFIQKPESLRVELVESFFKNGCPWSSFLVQPISKGSTWTKVAEAARMGRSPWRTDRNEKTRLISHDARVDHAVQLVLLDLVRGVLKQGTPGNVIGFVPGVDPFEVTVQGWC